MPLEQIDAVTLEFNMSIDEHGIHATRVVAPGSCHANVDRYIDTGGYGRRTWTTAVKELVGNARVWCYSVCVYGATRGDQYPKASMIHGWTVLPGEQLAGHD